MTRRPRESASIVVLACAVFAVAALLSWQTAKTQEDGFANELPQDQATRARGGAGIVPPATRLSVSNRSRPSHWLPIRSVSATTPMGGFMWSRCGGIPIRRKTPQAASAVSKTATAMASSTLGRSSWAGFRGRPELFPTTTACSSPLLRTFSMPRIPRATELPMSRR